MVMCDIIFFQGAIILTNSCRCGLNVDVRVAELGLSMSCIAVYFCTVWQVNL
jgi:hypothetical protein